MIVEALGNMFLFAQGNELGLLGGINEAIVLSVVISGQQRSASMNLIAKSTVLVIFLLLAAPVLGQETGQTLYLKASKLIRDGDYAGAKILLERVLDEFANDEIAIKADDKLAEILDLANAQQRERNFRGGPGLYVRARNGEVSRLPAYKVTLNNLAAESGRSEDGRVRALSDKLNYTPLVLHDVDKFILYTATPDLAMFRLEAIEDTFPYDVPHDAGPLPYTAVGTGVYEVDPSAFAGAESRLVGVSAPPNMGFDAVLVSQETGTWGKNPGPVVNVIWPVRCFPDYGAMLIATAYGPSLDQISRAEEWLAKVPDDPSIDHFIASRCAEIGDLDGHIAWSESQLAKAQSVGNAPEETAANFALKSANIIKELTELGAADNVAPDPELEQRLKGYGEDHESHVAYYILAHCRSAAGDYMQAEDYAKKAEKATKKETPLIWYCGIVGDETALDAKSAHDAAKNKYKAYKDEMKKLKKEHGQ